VGFTQALERLPASKHLLVVNYHRLSDSSPSDFDDGVFSATADMFERHISHLKRRHTIVSLDEAVDLVTGKRPWSGTPVLLTFDDGYLDCYTLAFPVLRSQRVPASFFLVTSIVGTDTIMWWDQIAYAVKRTRKTRIRLGYPGPIDLVVNDDTRHYAIRRLLAAYKSPTTTDPQRFLAELFDECEVWPTTAPARMFMNWAEAVEMRKGGMDIGSHTHSHPLLGKLSLDEQVRELGESRRILEDRLHETIDVLAYPVGIPGSVNVHTECALRQTGYRAALSFSGGYNQPGRTNAFDIKRVAAEVDTTWPRFRLQCALAPHFRGYWF
jgi:peptidoglycan/xylan/chitin deacetylase (PgdA/CDA1 family)